MTKNDIIKELEPILNILEITVLKSKIGRKLHMVKIIYEDRSDLP